MPNDIGTLHNVSHFVGSLASASEKNLGQGSLSICTVAGKKFGAQITAGAQATQDPLQAIAILAEALKASGIVWDFEPFCGEGAEAITVEGSRRRIRLVFRTCMVRNALFRYAHEQKLSLCHMAHGVFAGAMENILPNTKASLEIVHAGPNACLKELVLEAKS